MWGRTIIKAIFVLESTQLVWCLLMKEKRLPVTVANIYGVFYVPDSVLFIYLFNVFFIVSFLRQNLTM
jgi:hypothetical protein